MYKRQAQSSLPEPVVVQGVTVQKQSSNIVMFLTMSAKDSVYDGLYLTNYAKLNLVDQLTRVPGVGAVNVMGAGDYSMRVWLDPEAMRIRSISPAEIYQAIQSQNMEVSAGTVGQPIGKDNALSLIHISTKMAIKPPINIFGNKKLKHMPCHCKNGQRKYHIPNPSLRQLPMNGNRYEIDVKYCRINNHCR